MPERHVAIIGAGLGGLAAGLLLACRGVRVTLYEARAVPGGKMREIRPGGGGAPVDSGPTVFTMRWVFDEIFAQAGTTLEAHLSLTPLEILARHAWPDGSRFDLPADVEAAVAAVGAFAGAAEAQRFRAFTAEAAHIHQILARTFLAAQKPGPIGLSRRIGLARPAALFAIKPFHRLWGALGTHFHDPRLRQLFARYATYTGASPFLAPATLMLIAHVEQAGVWQIAGGMQRLAETLARLAGAAGARFVPDAPVAAIRVAGGRACGLTLASGEMVAADAVVCNADSAALAAGLFGPAVQQAVRPVPPAARSLSAVTWSMTGHAEGFPLSHHTVVFSPNYRAEFDDIVVHRRSPRLPTVYLCAGDRPGRAGPDAPGPGRPERLFVLVNAPPCGDTRPFRPEDIASCTQAMETSLAAVGLRLRPEAQQITTPTDFARLFPGTGGALYGRANHGWLAPFLRPGARSRIPGLYLAGGGAHPGAGVPMASLSGRLAAEAILSDLASMPR